MQNQNQTGERALPFFYVESSPRLTRLDLFCQFALNTTSSRHLLVGAALVIHLLTFQAPLLFAEEISTTEVQAGEIQTVLLPVEASGTSAELNLHAEAETFSTVLRRILLASLQDDYVDDREWRGTVERFDGVRVRGLRISKRGREVPHGIWHRYIVSLIRPEETFELQVIQGAALPDGKIPFTLLISLRARCEATFVWWAYGVKGINGTAISKATLQLKLQLKTSPQLSFSLKSVLPKVSLRPEVTQVELKLKDLDLEQVGVFDGKLVDLLGDGSRKAIEAMMQQQEGKIRQKLQTNFDRNVP